MPLVFYFSGIHAMSKRHTDEVFKQIDGHGVLLSLHGNYIRGARDWINRICDLHDTSNVSVLFDSGAFTAWNAGEPAQEASELASIYEYAARWCDQRFRETWFISLDVLPGVPNRSPTQEEVAAAVRQSDLNHAELIRALPGRILPVFHRGESPARLNEVQDMSPDYVCLSPLVGTPEPIRIEWSIRVEAHLKARNSLTQLHGLATTGDQIMRVVDWRSVDSTAWIRNAGMGVIFVEHDGRVLRLAVGRRISSNCRAAAQIDLIQDPRLKATVNRVIKERGFDLDRMRDVPVARQLFNLQTVAEWSRRPLYPPAA